MISVHDEPATITSRGSAPGSVAHGSVLAYHSEYRSYDFGPQHPLRPERLTAGLDLLEALGIWDPASETLTPGGSTREDLELVHDTAYIHAVEEVSCGWFPASELRRYGLVPGDTPPFVGMHEAAAVVTGGSIEAARRIMRGELLHAFNPAGGLHHALRGAASGFCIYNDPALAAAVALREFDARVLYVDLDCHHGDGVQAIFYREPAVMTVSFHETGRFLFPGTGDVTEVGEGRGRGFAVNIPVMPHTQDRSWLEAVHTILPPLAARFCPDLIVSSHGADTHIWDPLTDVALTTASFFEQARLIHELAHAYSGGRWLALGSGGYDWRRVVPRSWAILWAEMTGRELPADVPSDWHKRWDSDPFEPLPRTFRDDLSILPNIQHRDEIVRLNHRTVVEARLLHGLA